MWKTAGEGGASLNLGPAQSEGQAGVRRGWPVFCSQQGRAMPGASSSQPLASHSLGSHPGPGGLSHFPRDPTHESLSPRNTGRWARVIPQVLQIWKRDRRKQLSSQSCSERVRRRLGYPGLWELAEVGTQRSSWSDCSVPRGGLLAGEHAGSRSSRGHSGTGSM